MRQRLQEEVNKAMAVSREKYPNVKFVEPTVRVSNRMTRAAGTCSLRRRAGEVIKCELTFSAPIIRDNGIEKICSQTVQHEVAHLVEAMVYGNGGHGATWKHIMVDTFGLRPDRCHTYKVQPKQRRGGTKSYVCPRCELTFNIGTVRQQRMATGTKYRCKCGGVIKPAS